MLLMIMSPNALRGFLLTLSALTTYLDTLRKLTLLSPDVAAESSSLSLSTQELCSLFWQKNDFFRFITKPRFRNSAPA